MGKIYLVTDWHFEHFPIIGYDPRPADYEDIIIENYKKTVTENDTVINLGDVIIDRNFGKLKGILDSLPGKKILTMGNHDNFPATWYKRQGFDEVYREYFYEDYVFSHKPIDMSLYPHLKFNIHGHFHRGGRHGDRSATFYAYDDYKNICMYISDMKGFYPIELNEFIKSKRI